jgi:hypothetical protein
MNELMSEWRKVWKKVKYRHSDHGNRNCQSGGTFENNG